MIDMPPTNSRPVFICGGDLRPGPRDSACPDPLHDWPLPTGYIDAAEEAGSRLNRGWNNSKCPRCGLYGWRPGQLRERDVAQRLGDSPPPVQAVVDPTPNPEDPT